MAFAAITSNLEIDEGSDALKIFNVKDPITGLPKDLTNAIVEVQISFETLPTPIIFRSDSSPSLLLGGMLGTIRWIVPWMEVFNTNYGTGIYNLYIRYPEGFNLLHFKGFVTINRGTADVTTPGTAIPSNPFPIGGAKGPLPSAESTSMVLAMDHPVISVASTGGRGSLAMVPTGSELGVAIGNLPPYAVGVRVYLGVGDSATFTISDSQPNLAPEVTYTISYNDTGPNWDENLSSGQMMYIVSTTGTPKFRWI